jgi:hypothetical protein
LRARSSIDRNGAADDDLRRLSELAQRGVTAEAKSGQESLLLCQKEQLRALHTVAEAKERTMTNLLRAIALLRGLPARIAVLRVLDIELKDSLFADLDETLVRMEGELLTSEQALRGLGPASSTDDDEVSESRLAISGH